MTAVELAAAPRVRPTGWWGMLVFAATEATLFGTIVGSYFYLRINTAVWPPPATPEPRVVAPAILTAVLLATVVPLRGALASARRSRRGQAAALLAVAMLAQAAYFGVSIHLLTNDLGVFTPQQSAYGSIYYVLLGAAHAHVAVGLLIDLWLLLRLSTRLTRYRLAALEAACLYWFVVGALTVAVLLTEVSPRL
jgi:heme/copper-type cytochrome/quinol oxidase subunit 3